MIYFLLHCFAVLYPTAGCLSVAILIDNFSFDSNLARDLQRHPNGSKAYESRWTFFRVRDPKTSSHSPHFFLNIFPSHSFMNIPSTML